MTKYFLYVYVKIVVFMFCFLKYSSATTNDNNVIDFSLLNQYKESIKNSDQNELDYTFELYLQGAGFDGMFERYTEKIHSTIEKRLQDALILK